MTVLGERWCGPLNADVERHKKEIRGELELRAARFRGRGSRDDRYIVRLGPRPSRM